MSKEICRLPGAGSPGGTCGASMCPACSGGKCGLPRHIVAALQARAAAPYQRADASDAQGLEDTAARVLLSCGIRQSVDAYRYLQLAMRIGIQDPYKLAKISARLIPAVAEECGTTPGCVDQSIRTAVRTAFKKPNDYLLDLFPVVKSGERDCVPNRWFICTLADAIRRGVVA